MGYLIATGALVLLLYARRTLCQCTDTVPPSTTVTVYQVALNSVNTFSILTVPSSATAAYQSQGYTLMYSLNCVASPGSCGATIPLYAYENTQISDQYVNTDYGSDAPQANGYQPALMASVLCYLFQPPTTTTSTTTTTTNTPYTGPSTTTTAYTGSTTTTQSTTTNTASATTGTTTLYTGPSTTATSTTTGSTTSYTGPTTTTGSTTSYTGSTTSYTGPTSTTASTTPYTGPSTTTASTTPYTGPTTTPAPTTPYTGPSTTAAETSPYTGPSTTAKSTVDKIKDKASSIGWPLIIAGVLIAAFLVVAVIATGTWFFIRGGSKATPTSNAYANQAHAYKQAHADLPPQPVHAANAGVGMQNFGPTWTQPHSMYY
ncbi:unnamed protein product, partial [Mesorhabditis spiculigera]